MHIPEKPENIFVVSGIAIIKVDIMDCLKIQVDLQVSI